MLITILFLVLVTDCKKAEEQRPADSAPPRASAPAPSPAETQEGGPPAPAAPAAPAEVKTEVPKVGEVMQPPASAKVNQVTGEVAAIDALAKTLTLKVKKGHLAIVADDKTMVKIGNKKMTLSDVKAGDKVTIKYAKVADKNKATTMLVGAVSAEKIAAILANEVKLAPAPMATREKALLYTEDILAVPAPAPVMTPEKEPVYNVEVNPRKKKDPLVLIPGKETDIIFYIGPESPESVTPGMTPGPLITEYEGDKLELTVVLNCSLCEKNTSQQDQITYRPKDRASSKARFKIIPSSAIVAKSKGIGDLIFTVDDHGAAVDRIRVRAFVGDPMPEGLAAYVSPAKLHVETLPAYKVKPPDIIIDVGFAGADGKLPVTIRPRIESLRKDFTEFGASRGSGPEMSWEFKSGVTKADLDGLVLDIYKSFRTIMEQNNTQLQKVYKRLGFDATLERGAAMLEFSEKDREKMLDLLREEGRHLYRRIFREGAEADLRKAMDFIENLPSNPPLRVLIRPADVYAPWQILYQIKERADKEEKADPGKFWGFKYVLGVTHENDSRQGRQRSLIQPLKPDEIAFAGWRGSDPADEVAFRVRKFAEHFKSRLGGTVEPSYERKKFIDKLEKRAPDIKFVFAYGHATSGMVLDKDKAIISGVEWAAAHFKFSENDLLRPRDFENLTDKVHFLAQPIVILDACETGTFGINAMNNNGFVGALTHMGAGAVIVTESPVLANFAYHFGMNLIDELFDGKVDVSQAMLNVRLKHLKEWNNPLGLVYTLYGNPAVQIKGP